jgi:aminomethyltransferase
VPPCGLGARDTLRLEAGMNLYGQDMDESVTPLESGLAWTVDFGSDRDFVGRAALERQRAAGVARTQIGLVLIGRGVLRAGYEVTTGAGRGQVTSGSFAPTLGRSIALARVPVDAQEPCEVVIRDRAQPAKIVKPPFVRNGKAKIPLD